MMEIILKYCEKDSRFIYLSQENKGVVVAKNNAISKSTGKYILPLDGDDLISEDYLELAVQVLDNDNEVVLVYCDVMRFGAVEGLLPLPELTLRNLVHKGCCGNTSMFRRTSYDLTGGYKQEMNQGWEDWEFFISLLERGDKAFKINQPLYKYRIRENSRNNIDNSIQRELRTQVVSLHPQLYSEQYEALWKDYFSIIESRKYKIFSLFDKIIRRLRRS